MKTHTHNKIRQTGSALIVSLMILLVLTMLGVSSLSSTNLEERMSQNYQHATMAFQAAESAINRVMNAGDDANPAYNMTTDTLNTAMNATNSTASVSHDMDPDNHLANTSLTVNSSIVYLSSADCPSDYSMGEGASVRCDYFEIASNAAIGASNTNTTHTQGAARPGTGG